jgi:hypothetical protein
MNGKQSKMLRRINATRKEMGVYTSFPHMLKGAIRSHNQRLLSEDGLLHSMRDMQKA